MARSGDNVNLEESVLLDEALDLDQGAGGSRAISEHALADLAIGRELADFAKISGQLHYVPEIGTGRG